MIIIHAKNHHVPTIFPADVEKSPRSPPKVTRVTFSGLLNALDGVIATEESSKGWKVPRMKKLRVMKNRQKWWFNGL
jgi:hypothetical protein